MKRAIRPDENNDLNSIGAATSEKAKNLRKKQTRKRKFKACSSVRANGNEVNQNRMTDSNLILEI